MKRFYPFLRIFFIPPFGEIVVIITQIGKTLIDLTNLFKLNLLLSSYLFVYYSSYSYSVFNDHNVDSSIEESGGLKWTRTTDLALIRRAL